MRRISVVVAPRTSTRLVASVLKRQGVIHNATLFVLIARLRGISESMKAGQYLFTSRMSMPFGRQYVNTGWMREAILISC